MGDIFFLFLEKFAERGLIGKMESFGNFAYGYAVVFEQCHGLVSDFIANDRVRSFANHLFDDTGEVLDRDA